MEFNQQYTSIFLLALEYQRLGKKKVAGLRVCFCVGKCQNLLVLFPLRESISLHERHVWLEFEGLLEPLSLAWLSALLRLCGLPTLMPATVYVFLIVHRPMFLKNAPTPFLILHLSLLPVSPQGSPLTWSALLPAGTLGETLAWYSEPSSLGEALACLALTMRS